MTPSQIAGLALARFGESCSKGEDRLFSSAGMRTYQFIRLARTTCSNQGTRLPGRTGPEGSMRDTGFTAT
jgi:hypothetical protein